MNTNSPLIPQGTTPPRGKSSLFFKVMMILTVHVVLIGGMLLQGCKETPTKETSKETSSAAAPDAGYAAVSNTAPETMPPVSVAAVSNNQVATSQPASQPLVAAQPAPMPAVQPPAAVTPVIPMGASVEYVIASGDTFGAIAKRQHVSLKMLMDANPGVDAKKLRVGQKVQVPAATTAVAAASGSATEKETVSADGALYVVKSGDTLGKIARLHGTSFKKLMAMNDLKTTSIRVGQKLKMPAPRPVGAEVSAPSASASQPQSGAGTNPATSTATPATAGAAN